MSVLSVSRNALYKFKIKFMKSLCDSLGRFSDLIVFLNSYGLVPNIGSNCNFIIFSGVSSATVSISIPPSDESIRTGLSKSGSIIIDK